MKELGGFACPSATAPVTPLGIPRNKQITWSEAVYRIYTLPNGTELVLYRSPSQNTAEYVIRKQ